MSTVETARLILRPFTPDDIPAYAAIRAKPEVVRFLSSRPDQARADAERIVPYFAGEWARRGYGPWAAIDKETGMLRGHLGLRFLPEFGETEILYMLDSAVWNRGYASEGAAAARDFAFGRLGLARVIAIALPENRASTRVMEKTGLRYERMAEFKGFQVKYYALERTGYPHPSTSSG
ncbi:MAG: GNAT family N-acetyltransferase [Alphaproteobacteria bacterium]|nr:GNAT family N-acetyltransferase [Alphaproteobacteria bacterium]